MRVNEQASLTAMHTLFMREHNRWADQIAAANPGLSDEEIFQRARRNVVAEVQIITYQEWLPALLGVNAPSVAGRHYDPTANGTIINEFATAVYRLGHTLVSPTLQRVQNDGTPAAGGGLPLRDAFFNPLNITTPVDVDYLLKGLSTQLAQELDPLVVDDLRNFLFGPPGAGGLDLISLNIQRGRDHGLPDYNTVREALGLARVGSFADVTSISSRQQTLASLYQSPDNMDPWVGAMSEDHLPGCSVGPLIAATLRLQFSNLMEGDRFFYLWEEGISPLELKMLRQTRLSDIIRRNTTITNLQKNVFYVAPREPDTDGDGIPDAWEIAYGLDPNSANDAAFDADGDGASNLAEYMAATDPFSAADHLQLGLRHGDDHEVVISFEAMPGNTYLLQYQDQMSGATWQDLQQVGPVDSPQVVQIIDPMGAGSSRRFYRLAMR